MMVLTKKSRAALPDSCPYSVVVANFVTCITLCDLVPTYLVMSTAIKFCHQTDFKQGFLRTSSLCNWIGKNNLIDRSTVAVTIS